MNQPAGPRGSGELKCGCALFIMHFFASLEIVLVSFVFRSHGSRDLAAVRSKFMLNVALLPNGMLLRRIEFEYPNWARKHSALDERIENVAYGYKT